MKKVLISFIIISIIMCGIYIPFANAVEGTTPASIEFNLTDKVTIESGEETVTLKISLGKFTGIEEDAIIGYQGTLEYDENIFDSVKVQGLNGWTVTYSKTSKTIIADPKVGVENKETAELVFTLKDEVETGDTIVKLKNVLLTDDTNDFYYNRQATITIEEKQPVTPEPDKNDGEEETPIKKEPVQQPEEPEEPQKTVTPSKQPDATASKEKLPKAGVKSVIVAVVVLVVIAIIFISRYKSIETK